MSRFSLTQALLGCLCLGTLAAFVIPTQGSTQITSSAYHNWPEAFTISNGKVEAVIVPAIGRVMQFRFCGEKDGPFWENRSLDGKAADSQSPEWINFGGDKNWPAPQADWAKVTGRGWPPPKAFDSLPVEAEVVGEALVLRSKIDPDYGIRTERRITLAPADAVMEIETIFRKVEGSPVRVAVWTITQLKDPLKVYLPVPKDTRFATGYNKQSDLLPENLQFARSLLSCTRSSKHSTKIGTDASQLIWADSQWVVQIKAPRELHGEFPDESSSAEIYTNPDPNKYVELETLGPLTEMKVSDSFARRQTYRLTRRDHRPIEAQIVDLLK